MLDRNCIGVGIQIWQRYKFRNPAPVNLVRQRDLAGFVVHLEDDVLAEILQRYLGPESAAKVPHFVGPLLEFFIMRNTPLECDRVVFGTVGRFATAAGIAAFAVLNNFSLPIKSAHLTDAGDVAAIPFDAELEVWIGIKPGGINSKLSHRSVL